MSIGISNNSMTDMTISQTFELDPSTIVPLLGTADSNLHELERLLLADIHVRGTTVSLTGQEADVLRARRVFDQLATLIMRGTIIGEEEIREVVNTIIVAEQNVLERVPDFSIISRSGKSIRPKTPGQSAYVNAIDQNTIVFGIGPAGTGKTYLAVAKAVQALLKKEVSRIVLTRPAVEAGERLGFLPGSLYDKIDPYLRPLSDALKEMMDPETVTRLLESGVIEVAPLAYMRGRTLNDAFIILDEAQNTTAEQMKMFLTRLGHGSKMVITGDITQIDLPAGHRSGLLIVRDILTGVDDIHFAEFDSSDVVRHDLVSAIIRAYDRYNGNTNQDSEAKNPSSKHGTQWRTWTSNKEPN